MLFMTKARRSKVSSLALYLKWKYSWQNALAVTLEGTIIHKSGLITGGRSTHGSGKKWEDKDVQGAPTYSTFWLTGVWPRSTASGLQRLKDNLLSQLRELNKTKPRGKADDALIAEINRLESSLTVARDDHVSNYLWELGQGLRRPRCARVHAMFD